jgi:hypothetical protein
MMSPFEEQLKSKCWRAPLLQASRARDKEWGTVLWLLGYEVILEDTERTRTIPMDTYRCLEGEWSVSKSVIVSSQEEQTHSYCAVAQDLPSRSLSLSLSLFRPLSLSLSLSLSFSPSLSLPPCLFIWLYMFGVVLAGVPLANQSVYSKANQSSGTHWLNV